MLDKEHGRTNAQRVLCNCYSTLHSQVRYNLAQSRTHRAAPVAHRSSHCPTEQPSKSSETNPSTGASLSGMPPSRSQCGGVVVESSKHGVVNGVQSQLEAVWPFNEHQCRDP